MLYQKLASLVPLLGEKAEVIQQAYWINNPRLATQFEVFLDCITAKHSLNPSEFNSQGWKYATVDHDLKAEYTAKLNDHLTLASNLLNMSGVIPVVQGTRENAAHRIAKNGFGTLASLDPGWYGQGIYFTSKMAYAGTYSRPSKDGSLVFVISLAVPGNAFPITAPPYVGSHPNPQGYLGEPCHRGYQSHYTIVDVSGKVTNGHPLRTRPTNSSFDELVVFEPAQALPIFLVHANPGTFSLIPFFFFLLIHWWGGLNTFFFFFFFLFSSFYDRKPGSSTEPKTRVDQLKQRESTSP